MSTTTHVTIGSPVGPLTLVASGGRLTGLYMDAQRHLPDWAAFGPAGDPASAPFAAAAGQLSRYFAGQLTRFDLPLELAGTAFQRQVWTALRDIPYGRTTTYGELARQLGGGVTAQEAGSFVGANPLSILIPCHRVVGSTGKLTGYAGGLKRKQHLLELEGAIPASLFKP